MGKIKLAGKWVLITGASSGLGRELARVAALREKANLLVCARRVELLQSLKKEIEDSGATEVTIIQADLSQPRDLEMVFDRALSCTGFYGVINNAGITSYGEAVYSEYKRYQRIMAVDLQAVMYLSLRFLDYFKQQGCGFILNVTSQAGFTPTPYQAAYSAAKHGVQGFSMALSAENRNRNIHICTFVPGGIRSDMITGSGLAKKIPRDSWVNMPAEKAALLAVRGLKRGRQIIIPGWLNQINHLLLKLLPLSFVLRQAEKLYRPNK